MCDRDLVATDLYGERDTSKFELPILIHVGDTAQTRPRKVRKTERRTRCKLITPPETGG